MTALIQVQLGNYHRTKLQLPRRENTVLASDLKLAKKLLVSLVAGKCIQRRSATAEEGETSGEVVQAWPFSTRS